jgi:hypothetical protein
VTAPGPLVATAWSAQPGAFELLERGELDEGRPEFRRLPLPATSRAGAEAADPAVAESRWRALLTRLRGYTKDAVLLSDETVWVTLFEVHAPPGGSATLAYSRSQTRKGDLKLSILGSGFGGAVSVRLTESLKLPASDAGKAVSVRMLLTATRYTSRSGGSLVSVDVRVPGDGVDQRVEDLPPPELPDLSDALRWRVLRRELLSAASDTGKVAWTYSAGSQATWEARLGGSVLGPIGGTVGLGVEAEWAEEVSVGFELPYGHDYVFYARAGEVPLVPYCARER